jgi:hypothetical protein
VIAAVSIALPIAAFGIGPASAVHDTDAIELDGNAANGAAPGDDSNSFCHQVTGSDCSTTCNTNGASAVMGDSSAYPGGRCRASYGLIASGETTWHDLNRWRHPMRAFWIADTARGPPV